MDSVLNKLSIDKIYEYYDIPQIIQLKDDVGCLYLCTLYNIGPQGELYYIGTTQNIDLWLIKSIDLRTLYTQSTTCMIIVNDGDDYYIIDKINKPEEYMLPASGYYI